MNKARLTCFVMLVLAVIKERSVSLVWLAQAADSDAKTDSIYRRFQLFFALPKLPHRVIGALILKPPEGWILAMNRTSWQFGRTDINILVVTVIFNGMGLSHRLATPAQEYQAGEFAQIPPHRPHGRGS